MKVLCYMTGTDREALIWRALSAGFAKHGCQCDMVRTKESTGPTPGYDLVVFVGVRTKSRRVYEGAKEIGQPTLMIDKGYLCRGPYHRWSLHTPQPLYLDRMDYDASRLHAITELRSPVDHRGSRIVYVESTQKYYNFHNLGDVSEFSTRVRAQIADVLSRHLNGLQLYDRPRDAAVQYPFWRLLPTAHCVVVHGSTAGIEALIAGIPVVSIGSQECNAVHDLCIDGIGDAMLTARPPERSKVLQRCAQLAWCQFSLPEIESGFAWEHTKRWLQ